MTGEMTGGMTRIICPALAILLSAGWIFTEVAAASEQGSPGRISIDVAVGDSDGYPVTHLTAADFLLFVDGAPHAIRSVAGPETPWNFLLLFDRSLTWLRDDGSAAGRPYIASRWSEMATAIGRFLAFLQPRDRASIGVFENTVQILMPWRSVRSGAPVAIEINPVMQPAAGAKDLYGTVSWAVWETSALEYRKAVIVFTDGRDGRLSPRWYQDRQGEALDPLFGIPDAGESAEFRQTLETVAGSGVRLYFLAVNSSHEPEFQRNRISGLYPGSQAVIDAYLEAVRRRMEQLAEVSNGAVFYRDAAEDGIAQYARLYQDLQLGILYTIEFDAPANAAASVEVRTRDNRLRVLRARGSEPRD